MKKILEKSGKSQGISSEEKSGNPVYIFSMVDVKVLSQYPKPLAVVIWIRIIVKYKLCACDLCVSWFSKISLLG